MDGSIRNSLNDQLSILLILISIVWGKGVVISERLSSEFKQPTQTMEKAQEKTLRG